MGQEKSGHHAKLPIPYAKLPLPSSYLTLTLAYPNPTLTLASGVAPESTWWVEPWHRTLLIS